jgi:CubicO group peptidase (beta-lactamase class C family)
MKLMSDRFFSRFLCALFLISSVGACAQIPKSSEPGSPPKVPSNTTNQPHEMTANDVEAFLDGLVPLQLQQEDIAGAVVVIVKNGSVLFAKGYGYADVKAKKPVSPETTLFRPGSISKTFTWTAIMQLVEQGKINLDTDVNQYLDFQIPHTFGRPVTVRNLMTHTPGFEEVIKDLMVDRPDELPTLQAYLKAHRPHQIYEPGTIPAYSNYGADLAGYIVQRVSGLPFEEYVQQNIFRPLGMTHATFVQPLPDSLKPLMSNGYELASEDPKPFELVPPAPAPDGSLSVTGGDMAPFMMAHLQNGKYGDVQILQPQTAEMMHARTFSMDPAMNGWALGFYEESRNRLRIFGHGGDLNYFHSDMHLVPSEGLGFFVSFNSLGKTDLDVRTALWDHFLDRYFPVIAAKPTESATPVPDLIAGKYLSSRRAQTTILRSLWWIVGESSVAKNSDGTIQVDAMKDFAGHPKHWIPIGNMQFRESGGQQLLVFKPDPTGRLMMLTEDPTEIYQRVSWTEDKTIVQFALGFAIAMFAGTLIFWPIGALVRRHYQRPLTLTPAQLRSRLLVKLACFVELVALIAFGGTVAYGFSNLSFFSDRIDWWLRVLQLLFVIGFAGAIFVIYARYRAWTSTSKRLWAGLYSAGLLLASVIFMWFTVASRIVQLSLKY